jgi:two-component system sensor histidine kinase VicK
MQVLNAPDFLTHGGEMGELIRKKDWSQTLLGDPDTWPKSLQTMLGVILHSKFPMFIWWGPDLICLYNDAYRPSLGKDGKHPSILGQPAKQAWTEIWPIISPLINQVLNGGEATWSEDQLIPIFRNGKLEDVYWTFSYSRINNDEGIPYGVLVTCVETTEKVLNQLRLSESDQNLRNMVEQAPVAICVLKGRLHEVEIANEKMIQLWGKTREEVMHKPIFTGLPEAKEQGLEELLDNVFLTGKRYLAKERPVNLPRESGIETIYQNFVYEPLRGNNGAIIGVIAVTNDVTEQVIARQKTEEAEERARLAVDSANLGTFDFTLSTGVAIASVRLYEIFDVPPSAINDEIVVNIHPEDKPIRVKALKDALATGSLFYEVRVVRKDKSIHWVRVEGKVLYNAANQPQRMVGTVMDFTEKKEQEQKREEYIAIASHELRNPLTSLKLSLEFLSAHVSEQNAVFLLDKSRDQVKRLINMTGDLLNVSKISAGILDLKPEIFNLSDSIQDSIITVQANGHKNHFALSGEPDIAVSADKFRIEQVLINLLSNASKYSPKGSEIGIHVEQDTDFVKVEVRDRGIGIDAEKIPMMFQKFSRIETDKHIDGYGLGLYISDQIIRKHGGLIGVNSEKGKGSVFWFTIPVHYQTSLSSL